MLVADFDFIRAGQLLAVAARSGKQKQVDRLLEEQVREGEKGADGVAMLVAGLLLAGAQSDAERCLGLTRTPAARTGVRKLLIAAKARAGDFGGALALAQAMKPSEDQAFAMAEVALKQAEKGDKAGAAQTLGRALPLAKTIRDAVIPEKRISWLCLVARVAALTGDSAEAARSLTTAESLITKPAKPLATELQLSLLQRVGSAYVAINDLAGASAVVSKCEKLGGKSSEEVVNLRLAMAEAVHKSGKQEDAKRLFLAELDGDENSEEVMSTWARVGGSREAVAVAERLPTRLRQIQALLAIIDGLHAAGLPVWPPPLPLFPNVED
jgi:hypothetical protein